MAQAVVSRHMHAVGVVCVPAASPFVLTESRRDTFALQQVAFDVEVSSNTQPTHGCPNHQLCTDGDIVPLIHKALEDEAAQMHDPLQGWDLGQVLHRGFSEGPGVLAPEHDVHEDSEVEMQGGSTPHRNGTHKQKGKRARRRLQRARDVTIYKQRSKLASRHIAKSIASKVLVKCLPIARGGYIGKLRESRCKAVQELDCLLQRGFKVVEWDGRTPHVLLDKEERIIGVLAGQPKDDRWHDTVAAACTAMKDARELRLHR
ncbi:uncharacterized protein EDB91DRAFT_1256279 [Suillus paluster]|uniref:uncharacterized protein n=1 Tax=Suillus paluster TaxID=48578 RepID=UPI001B879F6F|nr:uncharacterized protein EDB91DRAFT_1256279 [Suillus paluster]KAG1721934.1 hypothetical protein EDB91DRAFT_1256279 [Suillus paluster]